MWTFRLARSNVRNYGPTRQDTCSLYSTCVCSFAAGSLKLMHLLPLKRQSYNQVPEATREASSTCASCLGEIRADYLWRAETLLHRALDALMLMTTRTILVCRIEMSYFYCSIYICALCKALLVANASRASRLPHFVALRPLPRPEQPDLRSKPASRSLACRCAACSCSTDCLTRPVAGSCVVLPVFQQCLIRANSS